MGRGTAVHVAIPTRCEQMLAYGHSHAHIRRTLGVDQDEIGAAIDRMEQACVGDVPLVLGASL